MIKNKSYKIKSQKIKPTNKKKSDFKNYLVFKFQGLFVFTNLNH